MCPGASWQLAFQFEPSAPSLLGRSLFWELEILDIFIKSLSLCLIVSYLPLQMESVREQAARVQLAGHPAARHRIPNSSLPLPAFDPNPLLTLALYDLWADLFPHFRPHPSGAQFSFGAPGLPTRLDVLRAIKTSLVSPGL